MAEILSLPDEHVPGPSTAAPLARMVHNPGLVLVYESRTIGARPHRLPLPEATGEEQPSRG